MKPVGSLEKGERPSQWRVQATSSARLVLEIAKCNNSPGGTRKITRTVEALFAISPWGTSSPKERFGGFGRIQS